MDEDEMDNVFRSQLETEETFGGTSYVSSQVLTAENGSTGITLTAKSFQDVELTDSDSSGEEDDTDAAEDVSAQQSSAESASMNVTRSQSDSVAISALSAQNSDALSSTPSPRSGFVAVHRPSLSRSSEPLISSARAKSVSNASLPDTLEAPPSLPPLLEEPPPLLSAIVPTPILDEAPPVATPTEEAPPRLPDLPELPVLRQASISLRVAPSQTMAARPVGLLPSSVEIPAAMSGQPTLTSPGPLGTPSPRERASSHMSLLRKSNSGSVRRPSLYNPATLPNGVLQGELKMRSPQLPFNIWISVSCSLIGTQLRWMCAEPQCYGLMELSTVTKFTRSKVVEAKPTSTDPPKDLEAIGSEPAPKTTTEGQTTESDPNLNSSSELNETTERDPDIPKSPRSEATASSTGEELPVGYWWIQVVSSTETYFLGAPTSEQMTLWRDAIEYVAPKRVHSSTSGGAKAKKSTKEKESKKSGGNPVSTQALTTVKTRLDTLSPIVSTATYNLIRLFFHGKYTFIQGIFSVIQSADADKVSGALARMFFFAEIPLQLIKSVIDWEVERTTIVNQLFRQDSIASKIMTAYTRLIAQPYLSATLKTSLNKIVKCGNELEVNPDSLNPEEREAVGTRVFLLQSVVTDLLVAIRESIFMVPTECRLICSFLNNAVSGKFNDAKATEISLAGYLFLRLINSAIVVPDSIGIVEKEALTPEARKSLTVVSKIILNMANQVEFHKEPYMIPFNSFLREKLPIIQEFIRECCIVDPDALMTATTIPPPQMILDELGLIYKILWPLQEKLATALAGEPKVLKRMKQAFQAIGPPAMQPAANAPTDSKEGKKDKKSSDAKPPLPPNLMHFASKSLQPQR